MISVFTPPPASLLTSPALDRFVDFAAPADPVVAAPVDVKPRAASHTPKFSYESDSNFDDDWETASDGCCRSSRHVCL